MARVAIIGSCITRDLWPIRGDGNEGLCYISRTSLPSLFTPALRGVTPVFPPPAGLTESQHRAVLRDLSKQALQTLLAHRPTHIIFDFIDERFDLLAVQGTLVTHSWELETSGYLGQPAFDQARTIARTSGACTGLWRAAAAELTAFIRATPLAEARMILHEARWAERYRDGAGRTRPFGEDLAIWQGKPASAAEHNRLLAAYDAWFLELNPGAVRVAAPRHRLADAGHRWGLSPFHYVEPYYEEIWSQLQAVGVTLPRAAAPAPPSVPAA
ncbi:MAG: DUF6270 domain-containing protein [Phenylobacterium sp.]|uniref:DUF6270 domain-containing protein n=1 Tax=Phenylobacterium sp. TaxID=1871053 RepID=UPI00391DD311